MSSISSIARNRLKVARIPVRYGVPKCDCDVPAKERTCWKLTNPGRRFWNCRNNMTNLKKCDYFEWKDEQQEEGYYKNLFYSLKQTLDAKEDLGVINKLRNMIVELEFFLSKEKSVVGII
ncbi:unnamed protein product [Lactuca virosa]|uniref:GRF-type domain-containing protein n=1 Tax=Lactuca virosa TaxID=75947 RepID=A0AAU9NTF0_9ASTR|nr:unnamed protein product [Lactuca virosa]